MDPKWFPPQDRPFQSGGQSLLAGGVVGVATLLLPPSLFRRTIAIPPLLWILYNLRQHTTGKREEDYLTAVNISMLLAKMVDVCVVHTAERDFHRVEDDGTPCETTQEIEQMTLWQKFNWSLSLLTTTRGVGWNWRVKNVDKVAPTISRSHFVFEQVLRALYCYLYIDLDEWYTARTFLGNGTIPTSEFFSLPVWHQILLGWKTGLHNGFTLVFGYYILAAVTVGVGLYDAQSWPPMFGSFIREGYTMRKIWGYCWHQFLRRTFETANSGVTRLLGIKKGTVISRYLQLYNAFFVSALIHHVGTLNCPYSAMAWCQFYFFMIQPVAISLEDLMIFLGKKAGLRDTWKTRTVGYLWVGCFLSYSLRYACSGFMAAGLSGVKHPIVAKFSVMDRLFG